MDLTTNAVVITDAIKFVEQQSKEKLKSSKDDENKRQLGYKDKTLEKSREKNHKKKLQR